MNGTKEEVRGDEGGCVEIYEDDYEHEWADSKDDDRYE